jgi:prefoldin subunit 5
MQYMKVDSGDRLPQLLQSIRALESKTESTMRSLDDKLRELKKRLEDTQNHIMDLMCAS